MTQTDIQCGEIQLGITYRKIDQIKFLNLKQQKQNINNNDISYTIEVECKYDGLVKAQKPTLIKRNIKDFLWLQDALRRHINGRFVILPILTKQSSLTQTLLSYFTNSNKPQSSQQLSITSTQISQQKTFTQTMIARYLQILSTLSIKHLYPKHNQSDNPLFIFIQQQDTYGFYLPLYEQQKKNKQQSSLKGYFTGLWEYVPTFGKKKTTPAGGLQLIYQQYQKLYNKSKQLQQKLNNHHQQLTKLSQNFIQKQHRNKIKEKLRLFEQHINNVNYYIRYLHLVMLEIDHHVQLYESVFDGRECDKSGKEHIMGYIKFVNKERINIQRGILLIGKQFIQDNFNPSSRIKIQLGQLYADYQRVQ